MLSIWLMLVAAVSLLTYHIVYTVYKPGLRNIPGPWLAKVTDLYRVLMVRRGRFSYEIQELHRKYGPTVRLGPDCVSLTDKSLIEDIYGRATKFGKSDWVKSSQTLYKGKVVPALMTTQDKATHVALKKSIASAYSVTTLMGYEPSVQGIVNYFTQRLDQLFIKTGATCPLDKWLQWYAYDVIGAITMSRPMGLLEQGKDVDNMLGEIQTETGYRAVSAQMPLIEWICRKNPIMRRFAARTNVIMVRARRMLAERLEEVEKTDATHKDFIARFLEAKEKHPDVLGDRNMLGFVGSNLQAGSDTTAIALRSIIYFALKTPGIAAKLRQELDSSGAAYPIPFQQAFHDFPYVDAVIREALRFHPPFALLLERFVPAEGLTLSDGTVLPERSIVGMFGYTMHRDKEIFGEDADEFNPDRWLKREDEDEAEHKERLRVMKAFDFSFGHGQRRCVGVHVAELQIYKLVPILFGLLDIELVNPEKPWSVKQNFFSLQSDIDVKVRWREGKSLQSLDLKSI